MTDRWLLSRPRGGLNDVLCQMEKSWVFAEKTGRQLIFDTVESGLLVDFDKLFVPIPSASLTLPVTLSDNLVNHLNSLRAYPSETSSQVTTFPHYKDPTTDDFFTSPSHQKLKIDLTHDYDQDIVVYQAMGGGIASLCFLRRVTFTPHVQEAVNTFLKTLPQDYVAVHVRHSDLKTHFEDLLRHVNRKHPKSPVFVASDSDEVLDYAGKILGQRLVSPVTPVERDGSPLHTPTETLSEDERLQRTLLSLSELFGLASGTRLYFTDVNERTGVSGFSRLAGLLATRPKMQSRLLNRGDNEEVKRGKVIHVAKVGSRLHESVRWWRDGRCLTIRV